jgi:hypothetical protein
MEKQLYTYMQTVLIDFDNEVELRKLRATIDKMRKKEVTRTKKK